MRVVAIRGGGAPVLEERGDPGLPRSGEVVLRTLETGLCGTDLWKLAGGSTPPGTVLGHELVGEVVRIGAEVARFAVGDRLVVPHHVACGRCRLCLRGAETQCESFRANLLEPGGFADQVRVAAAAVAEAARRVPESVETTDALFLEPGACVLRSLDRSGLFATSDGEPRRALIFGAGSMGLLHVLLIRALDGECEVGVVDPRLDRRELAATLGAAKTFEPGSPALAELAADAAFDCVGGAALAGAALAALRPGGTAVLFAHARADEAPAFELNDLFKHEKRLVGTYSGSLAEQERVFELIADRRLRAGVLVSHRLPLAEFGRGVELARSQAALKVVFHP